MGELKVTFKERIKKIWEAIKDTFLNVFTFRVRILNIIRNMYYELLKEIDKENQSIRSKIDKINADNQATFEKISMQLKTLKKIKKKNQKTLRKILIQLKELNNRVTQLEGRGDKKNG